MVVADTDVLIDAFDKAREPMRRRLLSLVERGELATTAVSLYELTCGPRTTAGQLEVLHAALHGVEVLPVTRGAAELAAAANRYLGQRGLAIAAPDALIAGVCIGRGLPLLTRNREHFARIPQLSLYELEEAG